MKKVLVMLMMSTLGLSQTMADNQVKDFVVAQANETRAESAFSGGEGTQNSPYIISTPEDLVQLSKDVHNAIVYQNKFFKMTNDIDMSSVSNFLPIGNNHGKGADGKCFMGTFDGCNHTIKNLVADYAGKDMYYQGVALFGITMSATIKNVTVEDSKFIGYGMVSPIVAVAFGTTIQNCHAGKNVTVTAEKLGAAGIVAAVMMEKSIVEDCSSQAVVEAGKAGGVAAGIIGCVSQGGDGTIIRRCVNFGDIHSQFDCSAGVLAFVEYPSIVEDCVNFGSISSDDGGGTGIAYYAPVPQKDHLIVKNSYNLGVITGTTLDHVDAVSLGNVFAGGGEGSCVVENCFYAEDTEDATSKTATAMQSADMKTQAFVDSLNNGRENGPWCLKEGVANGFPVPFHYVYSGIVETTISAASEAVIRYNAGVVTVAGAKAGEKFAVVDMAGRTVKMAAAKDGEFTIDLTNVPAGVYVIGNGKVSKKIVK